MADMRKNLNSLLRILYLHRCAFFVPCCVAATIVFVLSLSYPRTYMASTSFERRDDPVILNLNLSEGTGSWSYFRSTMVEDVTSPEVVAEAIKDMGLADNLERKPEGTLTKRGKQRLDAMARSLGSTISVGWKMPSEYIDIMTLTYKGPDPELGTKLVDAVKKAYIRRAMGWIQEFLEEQRTFFQGEAETAHQEWNSAKEALAKLQLDNPLIDASNPSAISTELSDREAQQRNLRLRRGEYEAELVAQKQLLAATVAEMGGEQRIIVNQGGDVTIEIPFSPEALRLRDDILEVEQKITSLKASRGMREEHPEIQELVTKRDWYLKLLEQQREKDRREALANRPADYESGVATKEDVKNLGQQQQVAAARLRSQVRIDALETKIKEVDLEMQDNEAAIAQLSRAKKSFHEFDRQYAAAKEQIDNARSKYKANEQTLRSLEPALRAIRQGKLLKFFAEQPAHGSATPVSPKTTTIFLLALMAGVGAGTMFVILAELFDHVLRSTSHVSRALGVPILETIDEIITSADRRRNLIRSFVITPVAVVLIFGITAGSASLAYLAIERPWAYERIIDLPEKAAHIFACFMVLQ
ncbi:MAG: hypothetical protein JSV78_07600 [Phycisphaerales bacterium]|nr:MAG: hypothetical protein JSV78_07600 [Phycisphaerales bacterium]